MENDADVVGPDAIIANFQCATGPVTADWKSISFKF